MADSEVDEELFDPNDLKLLPVLATDRNKNRDTKNFKKDDELRQQQK